MYNIALCDDEQDFADEMKQYIQRYQEESGEELRVMVFRNGLELIENYDPSTDLIFLDIQMDQMDGLETAKRIREKDEEAGIIFLTSLKQYALEGYQYQAVNYLIKPMKYIRLKTELDRWIEKCRKKLYDDKCTDTGEPDIALQLGQFAPFEFLTREMVETFVEQVYICQDGSLRIQWKFKDFSKIF